MPFLMKLLILLPKRTGSKELFKMKPSKTVITVIVTAIVVIMFADKINSLPLVNKIPKF